MFNQLGESWIRDPAGDGWRTAERIARQVISMPDTGTTLRRSMYVLASRALVAGGRFDEALAALDDAHESLDSAEATRHDAAVITLDMARIYRLQGREADAMRAFADVFAMYPEQEDCSEPARQEAAEMLLSSPNVDQQKREQASHILSGLRDQLLAERIMRQYGIR